MKVKGHECAESGRGRRAVFAAQHVHGKAGEDSVDIGLVAVRVDE
jgi:hypothetical protein